MYEGIAACGCSNSGAVCACGRELFQQVVEVYEVINASGFVYLPLDVREDYWSLYEQVRWGYFQHIGYSSAEVC